MGWEEPVCGLYVMSLSWTTAGPGAQQLLKVDHLGNIKLKEEREQKESRKASESKMKRLKDRVRVGK